MENFEGQEVARAETVSENHGNWMADMVEKLRTMKSDMLDIAPMLAGIPALAAVGLELSKLGLERHLTSLESLANVGVPEAAMMAGMLTAQSMWEEWRKNK